jgi:hypothetical protein
MQKFSSCGRGFRSGKFSTPTRRQSTAVHAAIEALETRRLLAAFSYTGSIATYTVPATGTYAFSVAGAQGGKPQTCSAATVR